MPLFYHKYVNYVLAHSVNYVITLYRAPSSLALVSLVLSLVHIDRCIHSNSEPEKCYPTNRTIGSFETVIFCCAYNKNTAESDFLCIKRFNGIFRAVWDRQFTPPKVTHIILKKRQKLRWLRP
jgi:hypothetical protein